MTDKLLSLLKDEHATSEELIHAVRDEIVEAFWASPEGESLKREMQEDENRILFGDSSAPPIKGIASL